MEKVSLRKIIEKITSFSILKKKFNFLNNSKNLSIHNVNVRLCEKNNSIIFH
jgi:ribosomal protein L9